MAGGQVDDGEAAESKAERTREIETLVVRPAVNHGAGHPANDLLFHRFVGGEIKLAAYPAHGCSPLMGSFRRPSFPEDKRPDCETFATGTNGAWEHCPNRASIDER